MWLWWTVLTLAAAAALLAVIALTIPFCVKAGGGYDNGTLSYGIEFWVGHRLLVYLVKDSTHEELRGRVLFYRFATAQKSDEQPASPEPAPHADREPAEPAPRTERASSRRPPVTPSVPPPQPEHREAPTAEPATPRAQDQEPPRSGDKHRSPGPTPAPPAPGLLQRLRDYRDRYEKFRRSPVMFFLRQDRLYRRILRALAGSARLLLRLLVFRDFHLAIEASAEDQATLGFAAGFVHGLRNALALRGVSLTPVFDHDTLRADCSLEVRTSFGRLIAPIVRLLVTLPYLTALWVGIRYWYHYKFKRRHEKIPEGLPA